jgi:DNA-binding MarR family transcriptional regulator/L-amino acid N-acyltransferase YncA
MVTSKEEINQLRHDARSVVRELGLLNDAYFNIGVTLAERHLLIELSHREAPTMSEIGDSLLLEKSTVSRLIAKAAKKGYIKCVTDKNDKRKRMIHITKKGIRTLHAFEPIAFDQTKEALLTLTPYEIKKVYDGVSLYAQGLKNSRLKQSGVEQQKIQIEKMPDILNRLNKQGLVFGLYEQKDEEGLYQIFHDVVETGSQFPYESSSKEEFHRQFFRPEGQVYVCRTFDGEVIGGFYLKQNYSGRSGHIANAAYMVKESYRGKGIGSLLVKASLHLTKSQGFHALQYNMVFSRNTLAIKLYERLGFSIVGAIPQAVRNADGSYQDGYIMHRHVDDL